MERPSARYRWTEIGAGRYADRSLVDAGVAPPPRATAPTARRRRPTGPARRVLALTVPVLVWALAARRQTRVRRGLAGGDGGRAGLAALKAAAARPYRVVDATAAGSGLTVKYLVNFDGGERALFKPLRPSFERVGGEAARHLEEPLGEVVASALARVLRVRNVPPAILFDVPSDALAAAVSERGLAPLLSRCPRYVSRGRVTQLAPRADLDGCALLDDVKRVRGALVRWEPRGLVGVARPGRWFLRGARALCAAGACPLAPREWRAWGDLEAFDAVLGNYDRQNNVFLRGGRPAPLDHNHVGANLTRARLGYRWCGASPAVVDTLRAAAAGRLAGGSLFAAVACEVAPDALPAKFKFLDANARAYVAHLDSAGCRRRRGGGGS